MKGGETTDVKLNQTVVFCFYRTDMRLWFWIGNAKHRKRSASLSCTLSRYAKLFL